MALEQYTLRNGVVVAKPIYQTTCIALRVLAERHPLAFIDLADLVGGQIATLPRSAARALSDVGLIVGDGIHSDTWAVIVAEFDTCPPHAEI